MCSNASARSVLPRTRHWCSLANGELLPVEDWPLIWRQGLITGLDTEEIEQDGVKVGIVRKLKQSDRIKRLELIGRHVSVQAFKDQVDVEVTDGLADRLARAKARTGN